MEELENLAVQSDPLLACCLCNNVLQNPRQLTCLHNCCQLCFDAALSEKNSRDVTCGSCRTKTLAGSEIPNSFVNQQIQRNASISESRTCGVCKENGEPITAAQVWCPSCRHSLCGNCLDTHRQYYRRHVTESLEDLQSLEELYPQSSVSICLIHTRPLEMACLNCEQAKCLSCWAECKSNNHEMHVFGDTSFDDYVKKCVARISSLEEELLNKSEVLEKSKSVLADLKVARARHLEQISQRKRLIVDAVEEAYQNIEFSTKNTYDDLEKTAEVASASAESIMSKMSDARNYTHRLIQSNRKCEIINQQKAVRQRLKSLSDELDTVRATINTIGAVHIDSSLPDSLVNFVKAWIGTPVLRTAANCSADVPHSSPLPSKPQHFSFSVPSGTVQLPVECYDVALTTEGRLLLAAAEHGLLEFCPSREYQLSRWLPPNKIDDQLDEVQTVAALSGGRAAVGLYYGKSIVLLSRKLSDPWAVIRFLPRMQWSPKLIAAHGEKLAIAEYATLAAPSRRLLITSVSTSWRGFQTEKNFEYVVGSLAITALSVVTASSHRVKVTDCDAYVLDAHRLVKGSTHLWRRMLSSTDEHLRGICTNSVGSVLYAALCLVDNKGGRVLAIDMEDGSELRRIALRFDSGSLLLPNLISFIDKPVGSPQPDQQEQQSSLSGGGSRASSSGVLAALCWDPETGQHRTVTVHHSV